MNQAILGWHEKSLFTENWTKGGVMKLLLKIIMSAITWLFASGMLLGAYGVFQDDPNEGTFVFLIAGLMFYGAYKLTTYLFGKNANKETYADLAVNLYEILVVEAPSSGDEMAIGATELKISLSKLPAYSRKRTMTLEAMLYVAAITASEGYRNSLVVEIKKLLQEKWIERDNVRSEIVSGIHDYCWAEIEPLLETRVAWAKEWLDEFYTDPEDYGPCLYQWGQQCVQEFEAMVAVIKPLNST
jgi:hypothetical protein